MSLRLGMFKVLVFIFVLERGMRKVLLWFLTLCSICSLKISLKLRSVACNKMNLFSFTLSIKFGDILVQLCHFSCTF